MKPKLILHVGLPKTGSSALQNFLSENAGSLMACGVEYPISFLSRNLRKHSWLIESLMQEDLSKLSYVLENANKKSNIVLSSEGLTNHLYDFSERGLAKFREETKNYDVTIVLILRDLEGWLRSYYRQSVVNPNNGMSELYATKLSFEEFSVHPHMCRLADFANLQLALKDAFGASRLVPLDYAGEWFKELCVELGIEPSDFPALERKNEGVPDWVIALMLRVNRLERPEGERELWRAAIQQYCSTGHFIFQQSLANVGWNDIVALAPELVEELAEMDFSNGHVDAENLYGFARFLRARRCDV